MDPTREQRIIELLSTDPSMILYFKNKYLTENMWKVCIENEPSLFQYMKEPSEEMIQFALSEDGANIQYLDSMGIKMTPKMMYTAVKSYPGSIFLIPKEYRTAGLREFACREDPSLMRDLPLHAGFINSQLKKDPTLVRFLTDPTEDQIIEAVKENPNILAYVDNITPKIRNLVRNMYPDIIPLISKLSEPDED